MGQGAAAPPLPGWLPASANCTLIAPSDISISPSVGDVLRLSGAQGQQVWATEWTSSVGGFQKQTLHPCPQSPRAAKPLRPEGRNFKLTQIFQRFSSMFQIDIYVGQGSIFLYCCYEIQHFSRNNF